MLVILLKTQLVIDVRYYGVAYYSAILNRHEQDGQKTISDSMAFEITLRKN